MIVDDGVFNMKVKRFVDLKDGDVFMTNENIGPYMKISEPYDLKLPIQKAVKLTTGTVSQFDAYESVIFCPYVVCTRK